MGIDTAVMNGGGAMLLTNSYCIERLMAGVSRKLEWVIEFTAVSTSAVSSKWILLHIPKRSVRFLRAIIGKWNECNRVLYWNIGDIFVINSLQEDRL